MDPTTGTRLKTEIGEERCVHNDSERARKVKIDHPDENDVKFGIVCDHGIFLEIPEMINETQMGTIQMIFRSS